LFLLIILSFSLFNFRLCRDVVSSWNTSSSFTRGQSWLSEPDLVHQRFKPSSLSDGKFSLSHDREGLLASYFRQHKERNRAYTTNTYSSESSSVEGSRDSSLIPAKSYRSSLPPISDGTHSQTQAVDNVRSSSKSRRKVRYYNEKKGGRGISAGIHPVDLAYSSSSMSEGKLRVNNDHHRGNLIQDDDDDDDDYHNNIRGNSSSTEEHEDDDDEEEDEEADMITGTTYGNQVIPSSSTAIEMASSVDVNSRSGSFLEQHYEFMVEPSSPSPYLQETELSHPSLNSSQHGSQQNSQNRIQTRSPSRSPKHSHHRNHRRSPLQTNVTRTVSRQLSRSADQGIDLIRINSYEVTGGDHIHAGNHIIPLDPRTLHPNHIIIPVISSSHPPSSSSVPVNSERKSYDNNGSLILNYNHNVGRDHHQPSSSSSQYWQPPPSQPQQQGYVLPTSSNNATLLAVNPIYPRPTRGLVHPTHSGRINIFPDHSQHSSRPSSLLSSPKVGSSHESDQPSSLDRARSAEASSTPDDNRDEAVLETTMLRHGFFPGGGTNRYTPEE
jgi:hypothetical protein